MYNHAAFTFISSYLAVVNIFNFGEQWVGTYSTIVNGTTINGALTLEVAGAGSSDVVLLAIFHTGQYCDASKGCLSPGVSEFYLNGTINANNVIANFTQWGEITDRNFPVYQLLGSIQVIGNETQFSGTYGNGRFFTTLACSAAQGLKLLIYSF